MQSPQSQSRLDPTLFGLDAETAIIVMLIVSAVAFLRTYLRHRTVKRALKRISNKLDELLKQRPQL
jgi:uncharacterized membrane protein YciS (DUF1049 family)